MNPAPLPTQTHQGLFSTDGREYDQFRPQQAIPLPAHTYILRSAMMRGYYLEKVDDMTVPGHIYGTRHYERIMSAYRAREAEGLSTGVWLSGEKGSGKTMLGGVLSRMMREAGLPTILVQSDEVGPAFNGLISHVKQALWLFDEYEKVYHDAEKQDAMLTVFAGGVVAKNLYVITTNQEHEVQDAMRNRPSRMRYFIRYEGIPQDVVKGYVQHRMADIARHDEMVQLLSTIPHCNFDIMQCAVEEHNRFGGSIEELLAVMNITRQGGCQWAVTYKGTADPTGEEIVTGETEWAGDLYRILAGGDRAAIRFNLRRAKDKKDKKDAKSLNPLGKIIEVAKEEIKIGKTFSWSLEIGADSKRRHLPDGRVTVTTSSNADGEGVLTFTNKTHGFSDFTQRF